MKNDIIYVGDGPGGLTVINSSDPSNPYVLTHFLGGYTWDIQIADNVAFIVNGWNNLGNPGFMILNVSNPSTPTIINNFPTDFDVTDLEVVGNQAFLVCGDSSLTILDISNYTNPVILGKYLGPSGSFTIDVEISGNLAFLSFWKNGLKVLDISDPKNITVKGEFTRSNGGESIFLDLNGDYVFLTTMADGVVVLDVSNPENPIEVGGYSDSGKAYGIFVRNNYLKASHLLLILER